MSKEKETDLPEEKKQATLLKLTYETRYWTSDGNHVFPYGNKERGNVREYNIDKIDYCCEQMQEAFDGRFICFGEADRDFSNKDLNINLISVSAYPEGTFYHIMPISMCPFCGSKFEIKEKS